MMSGLGNVLGNVYGDANDRPKKSDLSDVQDSMDALVEVPTDELESTAEPTEASEADAEETPALDELSEWIGDEVSADSEDQFGPQESIFETDGMTFLDSEDDPPFGNDNSFEAENPFESDNTMLETDVEESQTEVPASPSATSDDEAPQRADWLDELDGASGADWIESLPEGSAEEPEPDSSSDADAALDEAPAQETAVTASLELESDDAGTSEADTALESQDEQWLDDLFGADDVESPDSDATEASVPTAEPASPAADASAPSLDTADAPATPEPVQDDISDLAHGVGNGTPSLMELQDATAGAMVAALSPQTASVGADWIRSDDDIIPSRSKRMRRSKSLEIAPAISLAAPMAGALDQSTEPFIAPDVHMPSSTTDVAQPSTPSADDPIALFSPVDDSEAQPTGRFARKGRKSKKSKLDAEIAELNAQAAEPEAEAPDTDNTMSEPERGLADVIGSSQPASSDDADVIAAAPLIGDAGLPATPATTDPEPIVEEATQDDDVLGDAAEEPKKKRLQLTRKKKQNDKASS